MIYRYCRPNFAVSRAIQAAVEKHKNKKDELQTYLEELSEKLEYKSYPYHITHYDPAHKDYVASVRDDYKQRIKVDTYNLMIERIKKDVQMQRQVDAALAALDRPYLRGKPGVTRNVTGGLRDYFPVDASHAQRESDENQQYEEATIFKNEKRWIAQTIFPASKSASQLQWEKDLEKRPHNPNFHPDKGSKYDVATPYDQRFPYLADRLGHPEFLANPVQRLCRLESDMYHPNYNDQPFVQHPSAEPDPTLNFEEGEVLYENTRLQEWVKFWWWSSFLSFGYFFWVLPYNLIYKSNHMLDKQLEASFYPYHLHSVHNFDYMRLHVFGVAAVAAYTWYFHHQGFKVEAKRYVSKVQYNKDKELIFVTRVGSYGMVYEDVYETHHLEMIPHSVKVAVQDSRNVDLGMYQVSCLNQMENFYLYKDEAYWNPKLKKEFLVNHSQLVTKEYYGLKRSEKETYEKQSKLVELPTQDLPVP